MKRPTKKQIAFLRIALGMSGSTAINDATADFILTTQSEMKRLGGKFSLRDSAKIQAELDKTYNPEKK